MQTVTEAPHTRHREVPLPPGYRAVALYADDAGRLVTYPLTGRAPAPESIVSCGDVLTLRSIHLVPVTQDADVLAAVEGGR